MKKDDVINVNYCELCHEWVEEPQMVCEYRGRVGYITVTSEGWPDRKPVKSNVHRLSEAIKALGYYAKGGDNTVVASEALKNILAEDGE